MGTENGVGVCRYRRKRTPAGLRIFGEGEMPHRNILARAQVQPTLPAKARGAGHTETRPAGLPRGAADHSHAIFALKDDRFRLGAGEGWGIQL